MIKDLKKYFIKNFFTRKSKLNKNFQKALLKIFFRKGLKIRSWFHCYWTLCTSFRHMPKAVRTFGGKADPPPAEKVARHSGPNLINSRKIVEGIKNFLKPHELHRLGRLELQSRYVVEGTLAGRHRSPAKGSSSEFSDHRIYSAGDDPKHLDWKVLGRTDRYYIRRYEDRNQSSRLSDCWPQRLHGLHQRAGNQYHYACRLATALGHVVVKRAISRPVLYSDKLTPNERP